MTTVMLPPGLAEIFTQARRVRVELPSPPQLPRVDLRRETIDRRDRAELALAVARLDATLPDWRDRIDVVALDMASTRDCVLGQLFRSYALGLVVLYGDAMYSGPGDRAFSAFFPRRLWIEEINRAQD